MSGAKKKNIKKVKEAKFFHKSPPVELNTGFVNLERFMTEVFQKNIIAIL